MTHWPLRLLQDVADLTVGFPFRSAEFSSKSEDIRLLRGDNVAPRRVRWDGVKRWPKDDFDAKVSYHLKPGDIILAMDRPWIEAGLKWAVLNESDCPALLVQRVLRVRARPGYDQRFLQHVIGSPAFMQHVLSVQTGTAVPHISAKQVATYSFAMPPLTQQTEIAEILSTLDDKIELNRKMNETLEAMAQLFFHDWFIDFGPVRRKLANGAQSVPSVDHLAGGTAIASLFPDTLNDAGLPMGWTRRAIGDMVEIQGGSTPSTADPSLWQPLDHCWATPKDLSNMSDLALFETGRRISSLGLSKIGSGLLPPGTVLLSSRAPIGYLAIAQSPLAINQGFIALKASPTLGSAYLYLWCKAHMEAIVANANGSTFQEISKKNFRPIASAFPDNERVLSAFTELVQPLIDRIISAAAESHSLAETRDYLLPRLMAGQIGIQDAEAARTNAA